MIEGTPEKDLKISRSVRLSLDIGLQVSTTRRLEKKLIALTIHWKRKNNIYYLRLSYIFHIKLSYTESMPESHISQLNYASKSGYDLSKFESGWELNNFDNSLQNVINQNR